LERFEIGAQAFVRVAVALAPDVEVQQHDGDRGQGRSPRREIAEQELMKMAERGRASSRPTPRTSNNDGQQ
jgi:hypothetical protein